MPRSSVPLPCALAGVLAAFALGTAVTAASAAPAGAITDTVRLGAPLGSFGEAPTTFAQGQVWVATARGVVRVDGRTGRRVGRPLRTGSGSAFRLVPDGRRLWVLDRASVTRIDARRGVVTGRIPLPAQTFPQALAVRGRIAWLVTVGLPGPRQAITAYRVDTLQPCRACRVLRTADLPFNTGSLDFRGRDALISAFSPDPNMGTGLFRLRGGRARGFLSAALFPEVTADGAWSVIGTAVAHIDLGRLVYDGRVARLPGRALDDPVAGLGRIWTTGSVVTLRGNRPPLRRDPVLVAIDPATGGLAGEPVALPAAAGSFNTTTGAGSVWVTTAAGLLRIRPSAPQAPLVATPPVGQPAPILDGPLPGGSLAAPPSFGIGLSLSLADTGWVATPTGAPGAPATEALLLARADSRSESINLILPATTFGRAGRVATSSVDEVVGALRANPRFRVSGVRPTAVAGHPATRLLVRAVRSGVPAPLFGLTAATDVFSLARSVVADEVLLTTTSAGRLVAVVISRGPADPPARSQAVVDSLAFG